MDMNAPGYRVDQYGDGSYSVDFCSKNAEEPVFLPTRVCLKKRMKTLDEVEKAIRIHKSIRKTREIVKTFWYDEEGKPE